MSAKKTTKAKAPAVKAAKAPKAARSAKAGAEPKAKKLSALDAAAKVLAEEGRSMHCKELIETMGAKGYWSSPGGQTPWATLYSALTREIGTKGAAARFQKVEAGKFGLAGLPKKGKSVAERAKALIGIAHPDFREGLERQAYEHRLIPRGVSF